jgi:hypothetical protein
MPLQTFIPNQKGSLKQKPLEILVLSEPEKNLHLFTRLFVFHYYHDKTFSIFTLPL